MWGPHRRHDGWQNRPGQRQSPRQKHQAQAQGTAGAGAPKTADKAGLHPSGGPRGVHLRVSEARKKGGTEHLHSLPMVGGTEVRRNLSPRAHG